jgi:hypothetical protein
MLARRARRSDAPTQVGAYVSREGGQTHHRAAVPVRNGTASPSDMGNVPDRAVKEAVRRRS